MNTVRKSALWASLLASIGLGIVGCDWETPSDGEYWSDTLNWINFSGVYKNPNGGPVVTDFSFTGDPGEDPSSGVAVPVGPVTIASGNGGSSYSGSLIANVVPGSLQITAGGVVFTDNGSGGLVPSSGLATMGGSISYDSGAWNINLGGVMLPSGQPVTAKYSVYQSTAPGGGTSPTGKPSKYHGTSGVTIYSFTVIQEGQLLTLIDSDGKSYSGKLGSLRSVSGELGAQPRQGDTVIGQFKVEGYSRPGMPVEIVGVFQGTVVTEGGDDDTSGYVMSARSMQGQWIEKGSAGKTGEVWGQAKDAAIPYSNSGSVDVQFNVAP